MTRETYHCARYRSVGEFWYCADFSQASSNITVGFDHGDDELNWQPTPFQVADARHSRREAERLLAGYLR
jgi:hypothetical protein